MIRAPAMPPAVAPTRAPSFFVKGFSCCVAKKPAIPPATRDKNGPQKPKNPATQMFKTKPITPTINPILVLGCMTILLFGFLLLYTTSDRLPLGLLSDMVLYSTAEG